MSRSRSRYSHLNRVIAPSRRQITSDLVVWVLVTIGLFAMALAV